MPDGFPLKRWVTADMDASTVEAIAGGLGIARPAAVALCARGLTSVDAARGYLNPRLSDLSDPFRIPDLEKAAARVWHAIDEHQRVLIFGDYDVDGVSSSALLKLVLARLGLAADVFIPNRLDDGYGMSPDTIRQCLKAYHPDLLISVDCGITACEAVAAASLAGVDVIVTDHHEPSDTLPAAYAVVNPKLSDIDAIQMLAGVGVAFKLCHGLAKLGLAEGRSELDNVDLREFLDIVAVGTVADIVPLTHENRILTLHGLHRLNRTPRPGLRNLMEVAGISPGRMQTHHIGFGLGPRLNASGRMGSAETALQLLLADSDAVCRGLADTLDAANKERRRVEEGMFRQACEDVEAQQSEAAGFGIVVGRRGWHLGTVGIVAARLVRKYGVPAVVIGFDDDGKGRGSCRSIDAIDLLSLLDACADVLDQHGGHKMAAGLSMRESQLAAFRERFMDGCRERLTATDMRPVQKVDAWIDLAEADRSLAEAVASMQPFGTGNPAPVFGVREVTLGAEPRRVGKSDQHLRLNVVQGSRALDGIGFNLGLYETPKGMLDVVFQLQENDFGGRTTIEMNVKDLGAAQ